MSPGKECFNVTNMLLAQTSRIECEELCRQDVLGLEDMVANDQSGVCDKFEEQLVRRGGSWYETGLPWRGNHPPLPNNKNGSIRRLQGLVQKLESKNQMAQYKKIIDERREAGIIEPAEHQAVGNVWYAPVQSQQK